MKKKTWIQFLLIALSAAGISALIVMAAIHWMEQGPRVGGDFALIHGGSPWRYSDGPRDVNMLYVGYVNCPDVCPMTLSFAAQALRKLPAADQQRVRLVFVSVDVDHDTAAGVATYAAGFAPQFVGLTGTREAIDTVTSQFQLGYTIDKDPGSHLGYAISHSDRVLFLDRRGFEIDSLPSPRSAEAFAEKIKEHL